MSELDALGVKYSPSAKKSELEILLASQEEPSPVTSTTVESTLVEPIVEPVEVSESPVIEAVQEAEVASVEELVPVEPAVVKPPLGVFGRYRIAVTYLGERTVNGRAYHEVHLEDGTSYLMTKEELEAGLSK